MDDNKILELTSKIESTLGAENLVSANGALLQKLPVGKEKLPEAKSEETPPKKLSWKDAFDKNGNFIH